MESRIIRTHIKAPSNMNELRLHLAQMYADVTNDRNMVPQADTAANVAGKIIGICKLELEAATLTGSKKVSGFLTSGDGDE